jgi:hypothetical protein
MFSSGAHSEGDAWGESGKAFAGGVHVAPVAGAFSFAQIWNPAGSGVLLCVEHVFASVLTADDHFQGWVSTAAVGTLTTTYTNLRLGGAAPVGQMYQGTAIAHPGAGKFQELSLQRNATLHLEFHSALVIPPGYGYFIDALTANDELLVNWEWREKTA